MDDVERSASPKSFVIETDIYSGPLDLLIELIERRKLLINDISLAAVTDDYMRYVAMLEQNPIRETVHFVALAATLLLIKSKSLLPILDLTSEEEESVENLEKRLRLYQLFRNAAKAVSSTFGKAFMYSRRYRPAQEPLFLTDKYTELPALHGSIREVLSRLPKKAVKPRVQVRKVLSLEEMIGRLKTRIERQLRFKFREFTGTDSEKTTIIVGFLAILEMVKQGSVIVHQSARFHDIEIEREVGNVPRYS